MKTKIKNLGCKKGREFVKIERNNIRKTASNKYYNLCKYMAKWSSKQIKKKELASMKY